jgi:hypothetical protein
MLASQSSARRRSLAHQLVEVFNGLAYLPHYQASLFSDLLLQLDDIF